jgi:hypothetical protein
MNKRRWLFFAALGLFLAWVASLSVLAVVSGKKPPVPQSRPAQP